MRSYWSIHPRATLYNLAYHARSLRALQKGADVHSQKGSDYRGNSKNCGGRRGSIPSAVNIVKPESSTPTTTVNLTTNESAVMQIESNPHSILMPAMPSTSGSNAAYVDFIFRVCLEMSHLQARSPLMPNQFGEGVPAKLVNILKDLPAKPQEKLGYQPTSTPNWGPQHVPA